jgi:hypothetical protein
MTTGERVEPSRAQGKEILQIARTWSVMVDSAGDDVARIVTLRERMYAPQPEDFVVDATLLDPDAEYYPLGVGYLVAQYEDGSALIRPCDDMSITERVENADLVAIPGLGLGWPR